MSDNIHCMEDCLNNCIDVSVIVPLFHGAGYLENIIGMVERNAQAAKCISLELIFVNDSPEEALDFSKIKSAAFSLRTITNDENLGIQRARLRGVEESGGRYLFFLDQDDEIADDILKKLYDAVGGGEIAVSDWVNERPAGDTVRSIVRVSDPGRFSIRTASCDGNIVGPPGHCLIRRDCLPVCWSNEILTHNGADDYFLWLGILAEGRQFTHCEGRLYTHKYHSECYSNDMESTLKSEDEAFRLAADRYGIPAIWRWRHKRRISYHMAVAGEQVKKSKFKKSIYLLLYPEMLFRHFFRNT